MRRTQSAVVLALLLLLLVCAAGGGSCAAPFRCQRPFSALQSFTALAKTATERNCDFMYMTVQDASAEAHCEGAEDTGCRVTVRLAMRAAPDAAARLVAGAGEAGDYFGGMADAGETSEEAGASGLLFDSDDVWRYSLTLRALGDSAVHYKGFDGQGFSVCCDLLEGAETHCPWMEAHVGDSDLELDEEVPTTGRRRLLQRCPLPLATPDTTATTSTSTESPGTLFYGSVTKPVHRLLPGSAWEAHVVLWRQRAQYGAGLRADGDSDREVLGRVIVPFTLPVSAQVGTAREDIRDGLNMVTMEQETTDDL